MDSRITPEPSEAEREAVEAGLRAAAKGATPAAYRSPWRRTAIAEATGPDLDETAPLPRGSAPTS